MSPHVISFFASYIPRSFSFAAVLIHPRPQGYDLAVHGLGFDPARILIFGRSIGTGPALRLAARVAPDAARGG